MRPWPWTQEGSPFQTRQCTLLAAGAGSLGSLSLEGGHSVISGPSRHGHLCEHILLGWAAIQRDPGCSLAGVSWGRQAFTTKWTRCVSLNPML